MASPVMMAWSQDVEDDIILCIDRRRYELNILRALPSTAIDCVRFINDVAGDITYFFEMRYPLDERLLDLIREAIQLIPLPLSGSAM